MRRLSSPFPVYPFLCFSVSLFLCRRPPTPSQLQRPVVHRHPSSFAAIYSRHLLSLSIPRHPCRYFRSISIRAISFDLVTECGILLRCFLFLSCRFSLLPSANSATTSAGLFSSPSVITRVIY